MIRRVIITAAVALAGATAAAAPALASGGPVNVGATVNGTTSTISLTGLNPNITFPTGDPGTNVSVSRAEAYTVSTNDPLGMTLTITPGSAGFGALPNSVLNVQETQTAAGLGGPFPGGTTPLQVDREPVPGTWGYTENWGFNIPAGATPGAYSEQFTYLAVGN
jgi:hypothetical protein